MQLTLSEAFALAARHEAQGRSVEARRVYEDILATLPEHPGALLRLALQDLASGTHAEGRDKLVRALASAKRERLPTHEIRLALARTHRALGDDAAAAEEIAEAHTIAERLKAGGATTAAQDLLGECIALVPDDAALRVTLGGVLLDADRPADARRELEHAIALGQEGGEVWDNLGLAHRMMRDNWAALAAFDRAVQADPSLTPARANQVYTLQFLCEWDRLEEAERLLAATLDDPASDARWSPFVALAMPLSPEQQLAVARRWSQAVLPSPSPRASVPPRKGRLRVGYLSASFHDHPTGRLMAGLFEHHDRSRFEITGYSYGLDDRSAIRARVRSAFDRWRDVRAMSDAEVAALIRHDGIDVLIDRAGHTHGGRLGILASRPAPVQVHYMSFPGTIGFDAIDGVIADGEVVPVGDEKHFHERVWRLPRCYYVNDSRRGVPPPTTRAVHGLADDALVLACLNQSFKLRRPVFATWLAALRARPEAVLWLLAGDERMQLNLRTEARRAGIDPARLIFAPTLAQEAHVARLACADLALDTLPYGSHTTGCDALWMGVPMLTCRGTTFAGRVGASLLEAAGLPELIAESLDDYRARLLELASSRDRLEAYRARLTSTRESNPLFDTAGFTRDFESLLVEIYDDAARRWPSTTASSNQVAE